MGSDSPSSIAEKYPLEPDRYGVFWLKGKYHHVWMQPRPAYCDRGHFEAHVDPAPEAGHEYDIDGADRWPRYYMDFDRMVAELRDWLDWRESDGPRTAGRFFEKLVDHG